MLAESTKQAIAIPDAVVHPAADIFPMMSAEELDGLTEDIRQNGQRDWCVFYQGELLDGRNRWAACQRLGIEPDWRELDEADDFDPIAFVMSANLHRRHLTSEQKRDIIAGLLKQNPERSNRAIARTTKSDHKTVGRVRKDLESTGEVPQLDMTTGSDGKARPARRSLNAEPKPERPREVTFEDVYAAAQRGDDLQELARQYLPELPADPTGDDLITVARANVQWLTWIEASMTLILGLDWEEKLDGTRNAHIVNT